MPEVIILYMPMFVCFFWAVALLLDAGKSDKAKTALGIFMVVSTILYFSHVVFFSSSERFYMIIDPLYTFSSLSVFPLFYIYIRLLSKDIDFNPFVLWTLIPAFFFGACLAIIYSLLDEQELRELARKVIYKEKVDFSFSPMGKAGEIIYKAGRVTFLVQVVPFIYYSRKHITEYNRNIEEFYSSTEGRNLTWVRLMTIIMILTGIFAIISGIIGRAYFAESAALLAIPSFVFSIMLFSIGFLGFKQTHSIRDFRKDMMFKVIPKESCLSVQEKTRDKIKRDLLKLLTEREFYRKTDLRITDVSSELNTNRSYISNIVNLDFGTTFSDLINSYRVVYAKKLLRENNLHVLDYIAEESGFASVNSLLRAFKKATGQTPGQYRKTMRENQ
jgi:AraC-like DNA-binding protein